MEPGPTAGVQEGGATGGAISHGTVRIVLQLTISLRRGFRSIPFRLQSKRTSRNNVVNDNLLVRDDNAIHH
jgi:hypothetical protein